MKFKSNSKKGKLFKELKDHMAFRKELRKLKKYGFDFSLIERAIPDSALKEKEPLYPKSKTGSCIIYTMIPVHSTKWLRFKDYFRRIVIRREHIP